MHEQCGVAAVIDLDDKRDVVPLAVTLAQALQHRGELGAGIAWRRQTVRKGMIGIVKDNGLVRDVLRPEVLQAAEAWSSAAIAHTRYPTNTSLCPSLVQPYEYEHDDAERAFAFAFNGNIPDTVQQQRALADAGIVPRVEGDTEIIGLSIVAALRQQTTLNMAEAFRSLGQLDGAMNPVILTGEGDIHALRDRRGFHPLVYAEHGTMVAIASEDSAIRSLWHDASVRPIPPGHLLSIDRSERTLHLQQLWASSPALCFFEIVYFSDHRSHIDGISVANARYECGKMLAEMDRDRPADDIVVPVPQSAKIAANGYADTRGLRRVDAILRLDEGRTFTTARDREERARRKYDLDRSLIAGRSIMLIDDSLVRGTTMRVLASQLRDCGASAVHLRLASPPIVSPCFYGIDFPTLAELLVRKYSDGTLVNGVLPDDALEAMAHDLGLDSIKYLPVQAIPRALGKSETELCMACVKRQYPSPAGERLYQLSLRAHAAD